MEDGIPHSSGIPHPSRIPHSSGIPQSPSSLAGRKQSCGQSSTCLINVCSFFTLNSETELPIKLKSKIGQFWFFDFFFDFFWFFEFFLVKNYKISDFSRQLLQQYERLLDIYLFTTWKGKAWSLVLPNHIKKIIIIQ